ncbi:MAG: hypothetical protein JXB35_18000 [Anaerolineae bacterium]|nr:hypothetical protein [Anaerolineae bacterium]
MAEEAAFDLKQFKEQVRGFNKQYFNPFTLTFAGLKYSPYTTIYHTGRTSGRGYVTPVLAVATDEGFIAPLPYGTHVDWYRNIQAAGGCIVESKGQLYLTGEPELLDVASGAGAFPEWIQQSLEKSGNEHFLWLKRLEPLSPDDSALDPWREARAEIHTHRMIALGALVSLAMLLAVRFFARLGRRR